jgi:hypothetical protein
MGMRPSLTGMNLRWRLDKLDKVGRAEGCAGAGLEPGRERRKGSVTGGLLAVSIPALITPLPGGTVSNLPESLTCSAVSPPNLPVSLRGLTVSGKGGPFGGC